MITISIISINNDFIDWQVHTVRQRCAMHFNNCTDASISTCGYREALYMPI